MSDQKAGNCIFCGIIEGRIPGKKVYSDSVCTAFLDIYPINPGHVLIVPNRHSERFFSLEPSEASHLMEVGHKIYHAIRNTDLKVEAANFFLSDGSIAGQEVGHVHLHLVPRFEGDQHRLGFAPRKTMTSEALDKVAEKIRTAQ
jgi:histidine triad (HIT) family protein